MAAQRFNAFVNVLRCGTGMPSSASTRKLSSFEVGSTRRASTNWKNAASAIVSNPSRSHDPRTTSINSCDRLPSTNATAAERGPAVRSNIGWFA